MARRLRGEGSVYTNDKTGLHRVRVRYTDNKGESKTKDLYGATSEDVLEKKKSFLLSLQSSQESEIEITIRDWVRRWLANTVKSTVAESTQKIYKDKLDYVINRIGNKKMSAVIPEDCSALFNALKVDGGVNGCPLSTSTVNSVRRIMKQCFDAAVDNGIIASNPVRKTKSLRADKKVEMVVLDFDEMNRFITAAYEGQYIYCGVSNPKYLNYNKGTEYLIRCYGLMIDLGLGTGMRIGELTGLQWCDISYKHRQITVKQQISANAPRDQFDAPKTANSVRKIAINDNLLKKLKDFRGYQKQYADVLGDQYINYGLVFTNTFGKPVNYHNFYGRYFRKLVDYTKINPKFSIHGMRHTHASILLQQGVGIQVVSARLGHSSAAFTLRTYIHLVNNADRTAADAWDKVMSDIQDDN